MTYDMPCTQAQHDARYCEVVSENELARAIAERCDEEMSRCTEPFASWLMDRQDISDLPRLVAFLRNEDRTAARRVMDAISEEYVQWRTAQMTTSEESELIEQITEAA